MTKAIEIIKDEHRSMAAVIKGLQAQVTAAQLDSVQPDFALFGAMLDYIEALPDRVHHPKEDEYLFRFLRMRSEEAVAVLDELESQHSRCAELLSDMRKALAEAREVGELSSFAAALDGYASFLWAHMQTEEDVVMPMAEQHLTDEDWNSINIAFEANRSGQW